MNVRLRRFPSLFNMDGRLMGDGHMNKWIAIGLACCLPTGLAAEDPARNLEISLGTVNVLVIDDAAPLARDVQCARGGEDTECMAFSRGVLTAHTQKVSALHERGRWM
jgi:hypothetical protein